MPDDSDARLVILGSDAPYSRNGGSAAEAAAEAILATRGSTPRLNQNALVFLAADKVRLQDIEDAIRRYLAWDSIVDDKAVLNLDQQQLKQAETQQQAADGAATAQLPETYQWALVPAQSTPQAPMQWQAIRLSGQDALAVRASKRLRSGAQLDAEVPSGGSARCAWQLPAHGRGLGSWRGGWLTAKPSAASGPPLH